MGSSRWREQHALKEWTKRIDLLHVFTLQRIWEQLQKRLAKTKDAEMVLWAADLRRVLAAVNEEVTDIPLKKHQMPEASESEKMETLERQIEVTHEAPEEYLPALRLLDWRRRRAGRD